MADKEKISFLLDLDVAEFTEKGMSAKGIIEKIGSSENLTGLVEGLTQVGTLLGTAGVAAYAFKKAIDLTVEGEEIKRINHQFELLAEHAGVVPETLKSGLEEAAKGLIDTDDLLKIANESIVKLGESSGKLPEIMNIAMKATQVYGGDAKSNFQAISEAIANGNTRVLKHYGILIDSTKAQRDFAEANGTTADQLSAVGHQQAILNAALDAGNKAFQDVTFNAQSATTILQTLKITFNEIGQAFTLAFEKTIGPGIRTFLSGVQSMATQLKLHMQASIGEGAEQAAAKLTLTKNKITEIEQSLAKLDKIKGTALDFAPAETSARIIGLTTQLQRLRGELVLIEAQNRANDKTDEQTVRAKEARLKNASQNSIIDNEKRKKNEEVFRKEVERIDADYYKAQERNVKSLAQVEQLVARQKEQAERDHITRLAQIQNNAALTTKQKKQLEVMEHKRFNEAKLADDRNAEAERQKLLDNYLKSSENTFQGIARAAQVSSHNASQYLSDFGRQGAEVMQSFQTHSTQAFEAMGEAMVKGQSAASSAADAMKKIFLNVIADRSIATGSMMLLESIFPPNPIMMGAGAGLIALGGALKSVAGGIGSSPSPSISGGAGGSPAPPSPVPASPRQGPSTIKNEPTTTDMETATPDMAQQQKVQRTVQVNIAGNYLETDSSRRMLMDLMRQETDATGFTYNQIGA